MSERSKPKASCREVADVPGVKETSEPRTQGAELVAQTAQPPQPAAAQ